MAKQSCPTGSCSTYGPGIDRILLGVDGSPGSNKAAQKARDMAIAFGAEVVIVHVLSSAEGAYLLGDPPYGTPEKVNERVSSAQEIIQAGKVIFDTKILVGNPADEILKLVENDEKGFGLIVLGTKGHGRMEKLLVGSVAQKVLQHSAIPVLIVP